MPLKRCLRVYISYTRMAKLYTSDAGVTWPSLSTCKPGQCMRTNFSFHLSTFDPGRPALKSRVNIEQVVLSYCAEKEWRANVPTVSNLDLTSGLITSIKERVQQFTCRRQR